MNLSVNLASSASGLSPPNNASLMTMGCSDAYCSLSSSKSSKATWTLMVLYCATTVKKTMMTMTAATMKNCPFFAQF